MPTVVGILEFDCGIKNVMVWVDCPVSLLVLERQGTKKPCMWLAWPCAGSEACGEGQKSIDCMLGGNGDVSFNVPLGQILESGNDIGPGTWYPSLGPLRCTRPLKCQLKRCPCNPIFRGDLPVNGMPVCVIFLQLVGCCWENDAIIMA
jgi:hypothetical protein